MLVFYIHFSVKPIILFPPKQLRDGTVRCVPKELAKGSILSHAIIIEQKCLLKFVLFLLWDKYVPINSIKK